ncbi:TadE/TadG family type IV pilus assembly protein [Nocardiopsis sp. JB363]|uniref:TadE/TadG family type IV pilus assembly protein n=1 Tax=Nocardiopsis sp. JB363 TaxID=1434837 RepID=UPI001F15EB80|nr:TadE/TadG family type IV pilus assembly protein [Nocardiopsis sp. JB363]
MTSPGRARTRGGWWSRSDRGSAEALFVLPVVFVMVLAVVQVGLWAHAQHRAQTVASQALSAARAFDGSTFAAYERAEQAHDQLGGSVLRAMRVEADRNADQARVRVSGQAPSLLPGARVPVSSEVSGPVERLAP